MAEKPDWNDGSLGDTMVFIPRHIPSLPLDGADEDRVSQDLTIDFKKHHYRIIAVVYDEDGYIHDEVVGESFIDAYNKVRSEYPRAHWENPHE